MKLAIFGALCLAVSGFAAPPGVDVVSVNAGPVVERDLCLTIALGDEVASECGDLRLTHELPAVRTLSRDRAPALIYSSANARPFPIVATNVSLPNGVAGLTRVVATLKVNGVERARSVWLGSAWPTSSAARIALAYDASKDPTSIYRYALDVTAFYGDVSETGTATGELAVVNRSASYFGSGWWLAGLDQLLLDSRGLPAIWVGGDGSVRRYTAASTDAWSAAALDHPDTLKRDGSGFARILPGGVTVRFDSLGRHIATRSRLGFETTFTYTSDGKLDRIAVPFAANPYQFHYSLSGQLRSIDAPSNGSATRVTTLYQNGARLDSIMDPDSTRVRFQYLNTSSGIVTSRTNRLGAKTFFAFDAAQKVVSSKLRVAATDSILVGLRPSESVGLVSAGGIGAVDTALAYTRLDGPRSDAGDTTLFWLDRFGNPVKIRDALGAVTAITRGDARFPALATEVTDPAGLVTSAVYTTRGNPSSVTVHNPYGDGRDAVTSYHWSTQWDEVTRITTPEGEITNFGYDAANGNRLYEEPGSDDTRKVQFNYGNSFTLLSSVVVPGISGRDSVEYDARGNASATVTPTGHRTVYYTDALGRDTLSVFPIDSAHSGHVHVTYDLAGRVAVSTSFGPSMPKTPVFQERPSVADSVIVTSRYDAEGNVLQVSRTRGALYPGYAPLTTYYSYDSAGRKVSVDEFGSLEKFTYDAAGNVIAQVSARGDTVRMTYDAANRLLQRVVPQTTYSSTSCTSFVDGGCFFSFPEREGPNLCIASDTSTFGYDVSGRLIRADNGSARVRRIYYGGGALKSDTLRTATYAAPCAPMPSDAEFNVHVFGLSFTYDLDGRRSTVSRPVQLCGVGACSERYAYDPLTAALDTVVDPDGNLHSFAYDLANRLTERVSPGSVLDDFGYDAESNLISHSVYPAGGSPYLADSSSYDWRGKMISAHTASPAGTADVVLSYSGLGSVTASEQQGTIGGFSSEEFIVDALGNRAERRQNSDTFDPGDSDRHRTLSYNERGQLTRVEGPPFESPYYFLYTETYQYDGAGNTTLFHKVTNSGSGGGYLSSNDLPGGATKSGNASLLRFISNTEESTNLTEPYHHDSHMSYYGGDGKLRVFNRHIGVSDRSQDSTYGERGTFDEYRYDALGRRVLTRTRRIGVGCPSTLDCQSRVTRTVWDGDRIIYEIKAPGGELSDTVPDPSIESDAEFVSYSYAPGVLGVDEPIEIHKGSETVIPHTGWRGMLAMGTYTDGTQSDCAVANPCTRIDWPAMNVTTDGAGYNRAEPSTWYGSIASTGTEGSGLQYMRNRYYDPKRGQFTQADPIGLGGGLNLYGFAGGDPINFTDPFGLCPIEKDGIPCTFQMGVAGAAAGAAAGALAGAGGGTLVVPGVGTVVGGGGGAVVGGAAGLIAGSLAGAARDVSSVVTTSDLGGKIKRKIARTIETIGLIIGLGSGNSPPPKPDPDKDKPVPPVPTSTKSMMPVDHKKDRDPQQ